MVALLSKRNLLNKARFHILLGEVYVLHVCGIPHARTVIYASFSLRGWASDSYLESRYKITMSKIKLDHKLILKYCISLYKKYNVLESNKFYGNILTY